MCIISPLLSNEVAIKISDISQLSTIESDRKIRIKRMDHTVPAHVLTHVEAFSV